MTAARKLQVVLGVAALLAVLAGLPYLLGARFESGDIYPPYSSLRTDPLGTRALFDSLERSGVHRVTRAFQPPEEMDIEPDTALLYLGDTLPQHDLPVFSRQDTAALTAGIRNGMRVIVTLQPRNAHPARSWSNTTHRTDFKTPLDAEEKERDQDKPGRKNPRKNKNEPPKFISLKDWLDIGITDIPVKDTQTVFLAEGFDRHGLPASLPCPTSVCFTNVGADWTAIYMRGTSPVMAERRIGKGSIVLSSLSYFASNEALRSEPNPSLIAWLMGGKRDVIFDETHHGIQEAPGIAALLKRNGLFGLLAAIAALAFLYVWRQLVPMAPPHQDLYENDRVVSRSRDSLSGLAGLLSRNIPRKEVLRTCFAEWSRTSLLSPSSRPAMRMLTVLETPSKSPANDYNRISQVVAEELNPVAGLKRRRPDEPRSTEGNTQPRA